MNDSVGVDQGGDVDGASPDLGGDGMGKVGEERGGGDVDERRTEGEMDYKTFLDLVLAMENKQTPQVCFYVIGVGVYGLRVRRSEMCIDRSRSRSWLMV